MNIEDLTPSPTKKISFKLSAYKSVPQSEGCYALTTFEGTILYIGLTKNLHVRFKQHLDNPKKTTPTLEGKAIWFCYFLYEQGNLPKLERTWLNQFSNKHGRLPLLNKVNSPLG
jgi:hypothetical protein